MTEPRRVRTQVERDADGVAWRQTADHPHTDPGDGRTECDPCGKWVWPAIHSCKGVPVTDRARARVMAGLDDPPPADGETCAKWCGYCHLGTGAHPDPADPGYCGNELHGADGGRCPGCGWDSHPIPAQPAAVVLLDLPPLPPEPRRRWWHRLTRRAL